MQVSGNKPTTFVKEVSDRVECYLLFVWRDFRSRVQVACYTWSCAEADGCHSPCEVLSGVAGECPVVYREVWGCTPLLLLTDPMLVY
jgi:hypothetical protein